MDECAVSREQQIPKIEPFTLECYRLGGSEPEERVGKYSGDVKMTADGSNVPHGEGKFKTPSGYTWTGPWEDGLPHGIATEILDGIPSKNRSAQQNRPFSVFPRAQRTA